MTAGKKILVISDTHGDIPALEAILKWVNGYTSSTADSVTDGYNEGLKPVNTIGTAVFLGDGLRDLNRVAHTPTADFSPEWIKIRGNNDYAPSVPETAVFESCGHRFFLCHGHRQNLYHGYNSLITAARNAEAKAALFGHIHVPVLYKTADNLLLINPGSVGRPRNEYGATFAVINCIPEKPLDVEFWRIDPRGEIGLIHP